MKIRRHLGYTCTMQPGWEHLNLYFSQAQVNAVNISRSQALISTHWAFTGQTGLSTQQAEEQTKERSERLTVHHQAPGGRPLSVTSGHKLLVQMWIKCNRNNSEDQRATEESTAERRCYMLGKKANKQAGASQQVAAGVCCDTDVCFSDTWTRAAGFM